MKTITTSELAEVLRTVYRMADARKHDIYATEEDLGGNTWYRIVRLMNLCTACEDVIRFWKECEMDS